MGKQITKKNNLSAENTLAFGRILRFDGKFGGDDEFSRNLSRDHQSGVDVSGDKKSGEFSAGDRPTAFAYRPPHRK
jgi:hypothetical protein